MICEPFRKPSVMRWMLRLIPDCLQKTKRKLLHAHPIVQKLATLRLIITQTVDAILLHTTIFAMLMKGQGLIGNGRNADLSQECGVI